MDPVVFFLFFMVGDVERLNFWGSRVFLSDFMSNQTDVGPSLQHRNGHQVSHAHQVVSRAPEGEHPVHLENAAVPNLAQQRDRLQPAETFFDPLVLDLADAIAFVPRRPLIDRTAATPTSFCAMCGVTPRWRHSLTKSNVS